MMRKISQLMDLSGRTALVTGGAGHIGLAACEALVELGCRVAVLDLDPGACAKRVKELSKLRKGAIALPCDLSDEKALRESVREAGRRLGRLDILVHCAGYTGDTRAPGWAVPFPHQSLEAFEAAMRINLSSAFVLVQQAAPWLARFGRGSVILFSSIYGLVAPDPELYVGSGMHNPHGYGASKGGLLQLTRYLATSLAPRVRVNAISPGGVLRRQPRIFIQRYTARTPLKRMAREEDIKGAVAYLAGDLSAYVTGQNLTVDGGWTTW